MPQGFLDLKCQVTQQSWWLGVKMLHFSVKQEITLSILDQVGHGSFPGVRLVWGPSHMICPLFLGTEGEGVSWQVDRTELVCLFPTYSENMNQTRAAGKVGRTSLIKLVFSSGKGHPGFRSDLTPRADLGMS